MQLKHFLLNEHVKTFQYGSMLTKRYCETRVYEGTLRRRFVRVCPQKKPHFDMRELPFSTQYSTI